jgi:hypothetical protein
MRRQYVAPMGLILMGAIDTQGLTLRYLYYIPTGFE